MRGEGGGVVAAGARDACWALGSIQFLLNVSNAPSHPRSLVRSLAKLSVNDRMVVTAIQPSTAIEILHLTSLTTSTTEELKWKECTWLIDPECCAPNPMFSILDNISTRKLA